MNLRRERAIVGREVARLGGTELDGPELSKLSGRSDRLVASDEALKLAVKVVVVGRKCRRCQRTVGARADSLNCDSHVNDEMVAAKAVHAHTTIYFEIRCTVTRWPPSNVSERTDEQRQHGIRRGRYKQINPFLARRIIRSLAHRFHTDPPINVKTAVANQNSPMVQPATVPSPETSAIETTELAGRYRVRFPSSIIQQFVGMADEFSMTFHWRNSSHDDFVRQVLERSA
nr:hypothetical protein CFP56_50885 [Quercus suber]